MRSPLFALAAAAAVALPGSAGAEPCRTVAACLVPGDSDQLILSDNLPRTFKLHVPDRYTGRDPVALVLDFHGFSSTAAEEQKYSGQAAQADARGHIVVYPEGLLRSWNAYGCCSTSKAAEIDDVRFARDVIAWVKARANIDADRVYVTGISNGGGMAHRMACEAADVVRAAAPVAFPLNIDACTPRRPVTVVHIHGTDDTVIPYDGAKPDSPFSNIAGVPQRIQSAPASLAAWKANNGCTGRPVGGPINGGGAREDIYTRCDGGVKSGLVTVFGGPHVLYNGYRGALGVNEPVDVPIDVAGYIWTHVFQ